MFLLKRVACVCVVVAGTVQADEAALGLVDRLEVRSHSKLLDLREQDEVTLAPFTTDGCSGGMSATWKTVAEMFPGFAELHEHTPPWESCCVTHDQAYHLGGAVLTPKASFDARLEADQILEQCVLATAAENYDMLQAEYGVTVPQIDTAFRMISSAMFDAVRFGGGPCSGLPWRWGYGWPQCWPG